ncbi:DUF916 domain-containing protein [Streptomyces sp. NPDC046909]|uniref:WxL protein peptidoglycan domain-containing protein n=1 Tax=Streptomyces sp. NPDC046909 TaxID=3155617 RepID=UPI0033F29BA9
MRKLYVFLLSLFLSPFLGLALPATPSSAADNGSWSVYPAAKKVAERPYFYLSADPGRTIQDKVVVANKTARPMTFRLYSADAYNTERDGGFAVRTVKERMRGVGVWAKPAKNRVTVPAHGKVTVPFTLKVPRDAEPGDHPGAIVALDERIDRGDGSVALGVQRAVAARVYLRVGGPTLSAISVEDVHVSHHQPLVPGFGDSAATISYTLRNTGNVTLNPKVELRATGLFGRTLLARDLVRIPSELLPGQRVKLTEPWQGAPQLDWGDVTLTASARDTRESASASFFALPWLMAGVLLVVVAVGVVLLVRARRARAGGGRRPTDGAGGSSEGRPPRAVRREPASASSRGARR